MIPVQNWQEQVVREGRRQFHKLRVFVKQLNLQFQQFSLVIHKQVLTYHTHKSNQSVLKLSEKSILVFMVWGEVDWASVILDKGIGLRRFENIKTSLRVVI